MPSLIRTEVILTMRSHMPQDNIVFGFTFGGPGDQTETMSNLTTLLGQFFNSGHVAGGVAIKDILSPAVDAATPAQVVHYEMSNSSATVPDVHIPRGFGSPLLRETFVLSPSTSAATLPAQVAIVLSLHASPEGGSEHSGTGPRTAERRRGRLYIGPIGDLAVSTDAATGEARVSSQALQALRNSFLALSVAGAGTGPTWGIWSRKDNLVRPITGGFVDNRFDIQRRRGEDATFRETFAVGDVMHT